MSIQNHPTCRCLRLSPIVSSLAFVALVLMPRQNLAQPTYEPYTFTTLSGGGGYSTNVVGSAAHLWLPLAVAVDSAGNVYVAEQGNNIISKVTPAGVVTTLAGGPGSLGSVNGTGSNARFREPFGVATDNAGNVYVADTFNHTIRKVTPTGVVTTLAGRAGISGSADGTNRNATFYGPNGLVVDNATNIYVADTFNNTVRKMTLVGTSWVVTTLAGEAGSPGSMDGTNTDARFNQPNGVAIDSAGNLYVPEYANHTIRKMTLDGTNWVVTTLAGLAGSFGRVDGTNSAARFNIPVGVAVDNTGHLYVADALNNLIRKMTLDGTNWG